MSDLTMEREANFLPVKYREIILAVAFFLLFDLAVLILNFYTSYQIGQDASAINLAGRQRMLSQRMTKAVVNIQTDYVNGESNEQDLAELRKTVGLFDTTLASFRDGGSAMGGDGKPLVLNAIETPEGRQVLDSAYTIWTPYLQTLQPLLVSSTFTDEQRLAAVQYARGHNVKLLGLMNDLTTDLERVASGKAERLRLVQTVGIVLALLNFGFILFKFIRKLEESDRQTDAARQETDEILTTVKEGLFLLDHEYRIGNQFSESLNRILRRDIQPGLDFFGLLRDMVPQATYAATLDYVELLFGNRVKEALVGSLNPLSEVEVKVADAAGGIHLRYLSFQFNRVVMDKRISHLLVTVQDVTERVHLAAQLQEAKSQTRVELDVLVKLLNAEPATLRAFLRSMETSLLQINERLRSAAATADGDYMQIVNYAFRVSHALKGEASALGLEMFENLIHDFEKELVTLREQGNPRGDHMVRLAVHLDGLYARLTQVQNIADRIATFAGGTGASAEQNTGSRFLDGVTTMADRIAASQNKQVRLLAELDALDTLPAKISSELRQIAVQLVRNAVSHGIESVAERLMISKPAVGNITIRCKQLEPGTFEFVLRDDGCGLAPGRIRDALVSAGVYTREALAKLDDRDIVMKLFEPGVSTAAKADRDAGHGMGMAVIREKIDQIGGRLRLSTRENKFTEFSIRFSAAHQRSPATGRDVLDRAEETAA
jgi:signal transduction histidine kinase